MINLLPLWEQSTDICCKVGWFDTHIRSTVSVNSQLVAGHGAAVSASPVVLRRLRISSKSYDYSTITIFTVDYIPLFR